jgi:hypothetical protein
MTSIYKTDLKQIQIQRENLRFMLQPLNQPGLEKKKNTHTKTGGKKKQTL